MSGAIRTLETLEAEAKLKALGYVSKTCPKCDGKGWWEDGEVGFFVTTVWGVPCRRCDRTGKVWIKPETKP